MINNTENNIITRFESSAEFQKYGFLENQIINISKEELEPFYINSTISADNKLQYAEGNLIQDKDDQRVYELKNGSLRPILDESILLKLRKNRTIAAVEPDIIKQHLIGTAVGFPNGTVVNYNDTIYAILNGKKHPIPNPQVFVDIGYQWSNVIKVDLNQLSRHPLGSPLMLNKMLESSIITHDDQHYLISDGYKRPISNEKILNKLVADHSTILSPLLSENPIILNYTKEENNIITYSFTISSDKKIQTEQSIDILLNFPHIEKDQAIRFSSIEISTNKDNILNNFRAWVTPKIQQLK